MESNESECIIQDLLITNDEDSNTKGTFDNEVLDKLMINTSLTEASSSFSSPQCGLHELLNKIGKIQPSIPDPRKNLNNKSDQKISWYDSIFEELDPLSKPSSNDKLANSEAI